MHNEINSNFRQLEVLQTVSSIGQLQNDRLYRDRRGLFFIEGVRNFVEAVDHRYPLEALFYSEKLLTNPIARKLVRRLKRRGVPFARVTPDQFRSVSKSERASGIGAVLRQRIMHLEQIRLDQHQCWTALSYVRSPGNLGSLVRTSAASGGSGFIFLGDSIDPFDPPLVRATMGALFKQRLVRTTAKQLRSWVRDHNVQVIGASADGPLEYDKASYSRPVLLMLGGERKGLTQDQRSICHQTVRIPMMDGMDSLNLAVAGSLLMYQAFR